MTRFALAHYAAAACFVAAGIAHATGPDPGTEDPHVARWIIEDVIADDRSALSFGGQPVRGINGDGLSGSGAGSDTTTPVPVPPALVMLAGAIGVLAWMKRRR